MEAAHWPSNSDLLRARLLSAWPPTWEVQCGAWTPYSRGVTLKMLLSSCLCVAYPRWGSWLNCISQFSSVQSLSRVRLFATSWIAACQASLSITNSRSLLKLMPIESVMPSSHLILCRPLLLLPPSPPSIRVFSNESALRVRWPKYWSFSFSISPSSEHPGLVSFRMDWLDLLAPLYLCLSYLLHALHSSYI